MSRYADELADLVKGLRAETGQWERAPWSGSHGGRKAEGVSVPDPMVGRFAYLIETGAPDGAMTVDRAREGWAGAWQRQNTTRAGKSERRSVLVGSQRGATRLG